MCQHPADLFVDWAKELYDVPFVNNLISNDLENIANTLLDITATFEEDKQCIVKATYEKVMKQMMGILRTNGIESSKTSLIVASLQIIQNIIELDAMKKVG